MTPGGRSQSQSSVTGDLKVEGVIKNEEADTLVEISRILGWEE